MPCYDLSGQVVPTCSLTFLCLPLQRCVALQQACLAEVKGKEGANPALLAYMEMACSFGVRHQQVITRWGRFPHRNAILGRTSTDEEAAGLADGSIPRF